MSTRTWTARALGFALGMGLLAPIQSASAYVHALTPSGCNPVHWTESCVFVTTDSSGVPDMLLPKVQRIVQKAVDGWRTPGGSYMSLEYMPADGPREVGADGRQIITFRSDTWCRPADSTGATICYDASANAVTTISYVVDDQDPTNDGRIVDADIELNAVNAHFYDADMESAPVDTDRRPTDLWNTLSHELGHLQGLDHSCRGAADSMPQCARDGAGHEVVECADVEAHHSDDAKLAAIHASTMYPTSLPKDTNKRTPEPDDFAGVTDLYASSDDPNVCTLPGSGVEPQSISASTVPAFAPNTVSCSASPRSTSGGGLWCIALVLGGLARRRVRRGPAR